MTRRRTTGMAALLLVALLAGAAAARPVLPADVSERLPRALKPYAPGEPIDDTWAIGDVALARDTVRIELEGPDAEAVLVLRPRGRAEAPFGETASFAASLEAPTPRPPGLEEAARKVLDALRGGDPGDLYVEVGSPSDEPQRAPPAAEEAPAVDGRVVLLGLLALVLGLLLWDRRAPSRLPEPPAPLRAGLWVPLVLYGVALALRVGLSPMTFLHENSHGPFRLEEMAGLHRQVRPMVGQTVLQLLAGELSPRTPWTVAFTSALVASLQAPFAWMAGRALGFRATAAALGGLLVATLPVLVRFAGSEDAFPAGGAFLVAAAAVLAVAARVRSGPWLVASVLLVTVAGHFRPIMYTAAAPVLLGVPLLAGPREALRWLRTPWPWLAVAAFALGVADDLVAVASRLGEGTPMESSWLGAEGLRDWPLLDPAATPPWVPLAVAAGTLAGLLARGTRAATAWLLLLVGWLTFLYTASNGWPTSVRYASAYAWIPPLLVAAGLEATHRVAGRTPARLAAVAVALLAASAPLTHAGFIGRVYAQQREIAFQEREVVPALAAAEPGLVVTPWPALGAMSGTLLTAPVRRAGHRIVSPRDARAAIERAGPDTPVYWYRGLACWTSTGDPVPQEGHPACREIERRWTWRPVTERTLRPDSDTSWIVIGDGERAVEVGLYRLER